MHIYESEIDAIRLKFQGYHCKLDIASFAWRDTLNYIYSPFNKYFVSMSSWCLKTKYIKFVLFNPIPAGGGVKLTLPVVFFYKTQKVLV